MNLIPDTSHFIDLLRGHPDAVAFMEAQSPTTTWSPAAPVQYELEVGIQRARSAAEDAAFRQLTGPLPKLALDHPVAGQAAALQAAAYRNGRPLPDIDALTAGIADQSGGVLVTGDEGLREQAEAFGVQVVGYKESG